LKSWAESRHGDATLKTDHICLKIMKKKKERTLKGIAITDDVEEYLFSPDLTFSITSS